MSNEKRRGSFFGALAFFLFFFSLLVGLAVIGIYTVRDQLLLEYVREQGPKKFGLEALAINSIKTRPLGPFSVELGGLVLQTSPDAPAVRAEKILVSTPNNLLGLYQLWVTKARLSLNTKIEGLVLSFNSSPHGQPTMPEAKSPISSPPKLPLPINLELDLRGATVELVGNTTNQASVPQSLTAEQSVKIRDLTGIARLELEPSRSPEEWLFRSTGQMALKVRISDRSELPIRTQWKASARPKFDGSQMAVSTEIQELLVSTLGLNLNSTGKFQWPDLNLDLKTSGFSADLGVFPLEPEESKALGISGRLKGEADFSLTLNGSLKKQIRASGQLKLKKGQFPIALERSTPRPFSVRGPIDVDFDVPFSILYDVSQKKLESIDLQVATAKLDFTAAELLIENILNKKANVMLGVETQLTSAGEMAELSVLEFRLANLLFATKGQISINKLRPSRLEVKASLPDVRGWPLILPVLSKIEGSPVSAQQLSLANGSISLLARLEAPLFNPERLKSEYKLDLENLDIRDFSFPLALDLSKNQSLNLSPKRRTISGLIRGQVQAVGSFAPNKWNIRRANGFTDLKEIAIEWDDLFAKQQGKDLNIRFDAASDGTKLKLDRFDVKTDISSFSSKGLVTFAGTNTAAEFRIDQNISSQFALSQVYELLPKLRAVRAKIPSGSLYNSYRVSGVFSSKLGIEKSPLALSGKTVLRAPQVIYLASKTTKQTGNQNVTTQTKPTEFPFLKWPIIANSQITFDAQIESLKHQTGELKAIQSIMNLSKGDLAGAAKVAQGFGGSVDLKSIRVPKVTTLPAKDLKAQISGLFTNLNLSSLGEYLDPDFKNLIGGASTGKIEAAITPFAQASPLETTTLIGHVSVKNGFLSTAKLDDLANQKIAENPQIAKLLKVQPAISTKGASFDMQSEYAFSKGRMNLKNLKMVSPEKNALQLEGWFQMDLSTKLTGTAFLASNPFGGSFKAANSDSQGRLVVPINISGSLKSPSLDIAESTISLMVKRTIDLEAGKAKEQVKAEAQKIIDKKKNEAVDKLKEELKKRGLPL